MVLWNVQAPWCSGVPLLTLPHFPPRTAQPHPSWALCGRWDVVIGGPHQQGAGVRGHEYSVETAEQFSYRPYQYWGRELPEVGVQSGGWPEPVRGLTPLPCVSAPLLRHRDSSMTVSFSVLITFILYKAERFVVNYMYRSIPLLTIQLVLSKTMRIFCRRAKITLLYPYKINNNTLVFYKPSPS